MVNFLMFIFYLLFSIGGSTFLKLGGDNTTISFKDGFSVYMEAKSLFGFMMYVVSFLIWTKIITKYEISVIVPILTGVSQICFLIVGKTVFKERLNMISLLGVGLIIGGIVLLSMGRAK